MEDPSTVAPPRASPAAGGGRTVSITLDGPIGEARGVGPVRAERLARLGITTGRDLLFTLPRRYTDRTTITSIAKLVPGEPATVIGRIMSSTVRRRPHARPDAVVRVKDESGEIEIVFWGQPYLARTLAPGSTVALHGVAARYRHLTLQSPEFEILGSEFEESLSFGRIVPSYRLTDGLSQRWMRELVRRAVDALAGSLSETLPSAIRAELDLPGLGEAIAAVHAPDSLAGAVCARRRLAFEELFELVLALRLGRERIPRSGFAQRPGARFASALAALPFALTAAQRRSLDQILADMAAPSPMVRLLEGDVGSGKTVVALLAAMAAIDSGHQAAIMAPTEILAAQHARTALRLLPGVRVALVTGAAGLRERRSLVAALARGDGELAIGTQALLSAGVEFRRLGLVVIDEQHRFGVQERAALTGKGVAADLLVMTATPIPRSLALTVFGDLDLSLIDERPPGRRLASTVVVEAGRRDGAYRFLAERLQQGEQALVITPRIETDPERETAAALERFEELKRHPLIGAHSIGLLHGRLATGEREAVMEGFRRGEVRLLVATTMVEVGMDVAGITVIVIEHPECFGLSQLHQLRGRAGRAENRRAHCLLMLPPDLPREAVDRLQRFARTEDGFEVAELDLAARGPGELLGDAQHGFAAFRVADLLRDRDLVAAAHSTALTLLAGDPTLATLPALRQAIDRRRARLRAGCGAPAG